jgi:hypothetical protein
MADPQPASASPSQAPSESQKEPVATRTQPNGTPPNTQAEKPDAPKDDLADPMEAALREAVDKLRLALPALQSVDNSLAQRVDSIISKAGDPLRLNRALFQHAIAYTAQDTTKVLGADRFGLTPESEGELSKLAGSAPGLKNNEFRSLLLLTKQIEDHNLVRDIRQAAAEVGQQANQNTPAIRSQLQTLENRVRLAPHVATITEAQPQVPRPETPAARGTPPEPPGAETQRRQNGDAPQARSGSFLPGVATNAQQDGMFRALRSSGPFNTPRWETGAQPFAGRLNAFEARMLDGKEAIALRDAERSARTAMEAMEGFRNGEGSVIMNRIRAAAQSDPNGIAGVLSEMKQGGKYADLRQQFNNTLADEKGVIAAYDRVAEALAHYGANRQAIEPVIARRPDATNLAAKFEAMDKEIGQAASELPSRRDGKTMLEDLSKQVAELLQRAADNVRNFFRRSPSPNASPNGPSP